jgi:hypothetical protein
MNIFISNTGRCGSVTFIKKACEHISNFSSAHESRTKLLGKARFDYPNNHIEADNRLSCFLGRLERHYGDNAVYVHLRRDKYDTAGSFAKRFSHGIIKAYRERILMGAADNSHPLSICLDYCHTINANIELFLKDKTQKLDFELENAKEDFLKFWQLIGAEGDVDAALAEFDTCYNASSQPTENRTKWSQSIIRIWHNLKSRAVSLRHSI